eukprot:11094370-Ditylum_brightwellii.AAC.1
MEYHMIAAHGSSTQFNKHKTSKSVHVQGQGATDAPADWTLNTDIIIKCYETLTYEATITDPTKALQLVIFLSMFVDDNSLVRNNDSQDMNAQELMNLVKYDINL